MNDETKLEEHNRLLSVAQEYERKGYRVVIQPGRADIPDFLAGFEPDLIAYSKRRNVIIEVKSRPELTKSREMETLASVVNSQKGWQFDLIVINAGVRSVPADNPGTAETLDKADILNRLDDVRHLLAQGFDEAALLLAWTAIEAALRQIAASKRIALEQESPNYVIKQLYSLGGVGRSDYNLLQKTLAVRNSIAHGFHASNFNKDSVLLLCVRVQELLEHT